MSLFLNFKKTPVIHSLLHFLCSPLPNTQRRGDEKFVCGHCVTVRVGGGYIFLGWADANGCCVECGRLLDYDLSQSERLLWFQKMLQEEMANRRMQNEKKMSVMGKDDQDGRGKRGSTKAAEAR